MILRWIHRVIIATLEFVGSTTVDLKWQRRRLIQRTESESHGLLRERVDASSGMHATWTTSEEVSSLLRGRVKGILPAAAAYITRSRGNKTLDRCNRRLRNWRLPLMGVALLAVLTTERLEKPSRVTSACGWMYSRWQWERIAGPVFPLRKFGRSNSVTSSKVQISSGQTIMRRLHLEPVKNVKCSLFNFCKNATCHISLKFV